MQAILHMQAMYGVHTRCVVTLILYTRKGAVDTKYKKILVTNNKNLY